jgi:hypothetical protein
MFPLASKVNPAGKAEYVPTVYAPVPVKLTEAVV